MKNLEKSTHTKKTFVLVSKSIKSTIKIAQGIAKKAPAPCIFFLRGNMGSGKTTFTSGFIGALGKCGNISIQSPTFAMVKVYNFGPTVYHMDFFRIKKQLATEDLEALNAIINENALFIIEWPDIIKKIQTIKKNVFIIEFFDKAENERVILFSKLI